MPHCGDNVVDPAFGEICDEGVKNSDSLPDACRLRCIWAACGDGVKDTNEQCDDGNTIDADGCGNYCSINYCPDGSVRRTDGDCPVAVAHSAAPSQSPPWWITLLLITGLSGIAYRIGQLIITRW